MQSVATGWTAEETDSVRKIAHNLQVSWKKETNIANRTFTIGVSLIGGSDVIGINQSAVGGPSIYRYFDESSYVQFLGWERSLNIPLGGLSVALAEAQLNNTTGRFTPRHMGGNSELFTSNYQPKKPMIINAGFNYNGIDQTIPQFAGVFNKPPQLDVRSKTLRVNGADYIDFFRNRYLDRTLMFTAQRTDQVYETLFTQLGMSTAQYTLDTGINIIPFGLFDAGTRYSDIVNDLAEAENGHVYQDETGIVHFENRQHWDQSPYNINQRVLATSQVLEASSPGFDHIINVVEVKAKPRSKQPRQQLFKLGSFIELKANVNSEFFVNFDDPVIQVEDPIITGNTQSDDSGSSISVTLVASDIFAKSAKYIVRSNSDGYVTKFELFGRPARVTDEIYYRAQDDSSVTAYEENPIVIENDYIQDRFWANSYAQMLLNDYSEPEKLQRLTIRAIPELQLGDLISWQGRSWRVYGIKGKVGPSTGFIQELDLLQRTIVSYFRIGISTIGGTDRIAP